MEWQTHWLYLQVTVDCFIIWWVLYHAHCYGGSRGVLIILWCGVWMSSVIQFCCFERFVILEWRKCAYVTRVLADYFYWPCREICSVWGRCPAERGEQTLGTQDTTLWGSYVQGDGVWGELAHFHHLWSAGEEVMNPVTEWSVKAEVWEFDS